MVRGFVGWNINDKTDETPIGMLLNYVPDQNIIINNENIIRNNNGNNMDNNNDVNNGSNMSNNLGNNKKSNNERISLCHWFWWWSRNSI